MTKDEFIEQVRYFTSEGFIDEMREAAEESGSSNPGILADAVAFSCIRRMFLKMEG